MRALASALGIGLVAVLATPMANAQESPTHTLIAGVPADQCPSTVLVAGRGNDSKGNFEPTSYSPESPFISNGLEGENFQSFLLFAEQRFKERNDGESLLKNTHVLGLPEEYYPAEVAVPEVQDVSDIAQIALYAGPIALNMANDLVDSVERGIPGTRIAIEKFEAETGCSPQYILMGYSLGATVLQQQEAWLADRGQLAGALYIGSAHQAPDDPAVLGATGGTGGILGMLPDNSRSLARTENRITYCLPDDLACDFSIDSVQRAISETDQSPHARYFLYPQEETDIAEVADRFSAWIVRQEVGAKDL